MAMMSFSFSSAWLTRVPFTNVPLRLSRSMIRYRSVGDTISPQSANNQQSRSLRSKRYLWCPPGSNESICECDQDRAGRQERPAVSRT
jgi:hypothetical protein